MDPRHFPRAVAGPLEVLANLRKAYGPQADWWPVDRAWHEAQGTDWRFEVCVGAVLVQHTAWANVERAIATLKERGLLAPKKMAMATPSALADAIRAAGHQNQKASCLRGFARYVAKLEGGLDRLFRGRPARCREVLLSFTGIGDETADAILVYAANVPVFVVDEYARRLTKRLRLGAGDESIERLKSLWGTRLLPTAAAFGEAHALIVEHAKQRCTAKLPRCPGCPLEEVCPQVGVEPEVYGHLRRSK